MRVISGTHRSRKLKEVPSEATRETKDRVKEALFNSIQPQLYDAKVLDLFCGSGSLGIEALSRGAMHCDFIDQSHHAYDITNFNVTNLGLFRQASVVQAEALSFLQSQNTPYDVILLDPPYDADILGETVQLIATNKLLSNIGIIVALHPKNEVLSCTDCGIMEYKTKTIGITKLTYMKWGKHDESSSLSR